MTCHLMDQFMIGTPAGWLVSCRLCFGVCRVFAFGCVLCCVWVVLVCVVGCLCRWFSCRAVLVGCVLFLVWRVFVVGVSRVFVGLVVFVLCVVPRALFVL